VAFALIALLIAGCAPDPGAVPTAEVEPTVSAASTITATVIEQPTVAPMETPGGQVINTGDQGLNIRADASQDARVITGLKPGEKFTILGKAGSWWRIEVSGDSTTSGLPATGYVSENFVTANASAMQLPQATAEVRATVVPPTQASVPEAKATAQATKAPDKATAQAQPAQAPTAKPPEKAPQTFEEAGISLGTETTNLVCEDSGECQMRPILWVRVVRVVEGIDSGGNKQLLLRVNVDATQKTSMVTIIEDLANAPAKEAVAKMDAIYPEQSGVYNYWPYFRRETKGIRRQSPIIGLHDIAPGETIGLLTNEVKIAAIKEGRYSTLVGAVVSLR